MFDQIKEECGVFGIYDNNGLDVVSKTYYALYALQHRGQEACGIAVNDDGIFTSYKDVGLVPEVFNKDVLAKLHTGKIAIGHVRYSTTGDANRLNSQPLVMKYIKGTLSLAHNGNIINAQELREELAHSGAIFQTSGDTEIIAYMIARARLETGSVEKAVQQCMHRIKGAFSLVISSPQKLIAARDPNGFRPLCIGKIEDSYVFASESCALDSVGAEFVRDVLPGEVVVVDQNGLRSNRENCGGKTSLCIFEYIYFARPDSVLDGASVHKARQAAGKLLAQDYPVDADIVVGVPDSGLDAAVGYALESGIPYGLGFIKNKYIGRTFIQPTQDERENALKIKLNALSSAVNGKRVVMVDDSIVRGTTCARIVQLLRDAGALEVHVRISSPPFMNPCYFGTDIDSKDKLIACKMSLDEIRASIGADSLGYLKLDTIDQIALDCNLGFCKGCFTGSYPIEVPVDMPKDRFEQKLRQKNS